MVDAEQIFAPVCVGRDSGVKAALTRGFHSIFVGRCVATRGRVWQWNQVRIQNRLGDGGDGNLVVREVYPAKNAALGMCSRHAWAIRILLARKAAGCGSRGERWADIVEVTGALGD